MIVETAPRGWSVFDPAGATWEESKRPPASTSHQIGDDFMLGRWTDELDAEYVLMYRLEKPPGTTRVTHSHAHAHGG